MAIQGPLPAGIRGLHAIQPDPAIRDPGSDQPKPTCCTTIPILNDPWIANRNLHFRNAITEGSVVAEFNYSRYQIGNTKDRFTGYLLCRVVACTATCPKRKSTASGTSSNRSAPEGQGTTAGGGRYATTGFAIPFGFGFKWNLGHFSALNIEWGMRRTWTDHLDDVAGYYASLAVLEDESGPLSEMLSEERIEIEGDSKTPWAKCAGTMAWMTGSRMVQVRSPSASTSRRPPVGTVDPHPRLGLGEKLPNPRRCPALPCSSRAFASPSPCRLPARTSPWSIPPPSANPLPRHVAVIMDGNGRWARERGEDRDLRPRPRGGERPIRGPHAAGELGVEFLTLYAFSTENWSRPKEEINALMELLVSSLAGEVEELAPRRTIAFRRCAGQPARSLPCGFARRGGPHRTLHRPDAHFWR